MIYFWKQCKRRRRSSYTCSHIYFLSTVKSHYVMTLRMQEFLFSSKFICSRPANSGRAQTIATLSRRDFELGCRLGGISGSHRPRFGMLSTGGGRLARARLIGCPPPTGHSAQCLRPISASSHLPFPFSPTLSSPGLPSQAATAGRPAASFVTSSPSPLPAASIHQVRPPLLFPSAVRDGARLKP